MRWKFGLVVLVATVCAGCNSDTSSDPSAAKMAADAAPKSASELPSNMPPEARAAAVAGIGQAEAQKKMNEDPARLHALEMMKKQAGH